MVRWNSNCKVIEGVDRGVFVFRQINYQDGGGINGEWEANHKFNGCIG